MKYTQFKLLQLSSKIEKHFVIGNNIATVLL